MKKEGQKQIKLNLSEKINYIYSSKSKNVSTTSDTILNISDIADIFKIYFSIRDWFYP
jgi:hypothetical protein